MPSVEAQHIETRDPCFVAGRSAVILGVLGVRWEEADE